MPKHTTACRAEIHNMKGLFATIRSVPENYSLAQISGIDAATEDQNEGNLYLFTAAPAMLAALKRFAALNIVATPADYAAKGPAAFTPLEREIIAAQNEARAAWAAAEGRADA